MPVEVRYYFLEIFPLPFRRQLQEGQSITIPPRVRGKKKQTLTAKAEGWVELFDDKEHQKKLHHVAKQPITRFGRILTVEITSGWYKRRKI